MRTVKAESIANADVFYYIRLEDRKGEPFAQRAWQELKTRLSSNHARRCARALLNNDALKKALDPLLDIPGMRCGMILSTMHKLLDTKADEEAVAYLEHTYATWVKIAGSREAMRKIAPVDVETLELRCPRFCIRDAASVTEKVEKGLIFQAFTQSERRDILTEILSIDSIITSLHTFSQDIHVLESCATSMRHLVAPYNRTIRQSLMSCFESTRGQGFDMEDDRTVQETQSTAIRELWAFMLQNFHLMPRPSARTGRRLLAGPLAEPSHQETVVRSAKLAWRLGFRTPEIEDLLRVGRSDPSEHTVGLEMHPQRQAAPRPNGDVLAALVTKGHVESLSRRCGRPRKDSHQLDQALLTIDNLDADFASIYCQGPELSSFFVLRCQYRAFFGSSSMTSRSPAPPKSAQNYLASRPASNRPWEIEREEVPTLVQSIAEMRRYSDDSTYSKSPSSSNTAGAPDSPPAAPTSSAPEKLSRESLRSSPALVLFRLFEEGEESRFHTVAEADAGDPARVESAARRLLRRSMVLYSTELQSVLPHECLEAALASRLNTIIVLPNMDVRISPGLKRAVGELRTPA